MTKYQNCNLNTLPKSLLVALQALKRKKRYEQQLEQLQGTLTTIESQREALENANTNAAVLDTMKGAADALKQTHKDMNVVRRPSIKSEEKYRKIDNFRKNSKPFG